jgi:glutamate-ammonia-ligase adenylyltransferase
MLEAPQPKAGKTGLKHVEALLAEEGGPALAAVLASHPAARILLAGVQEGSPFLWRLIERDPARTAMLLSAEPDAHIAHLCAEARGAELLDEGEAMRRLRRLRAEAALMIGFCDLGGLWSVDRVVAALTEFADACVQGAFGLMLRDAIERSDILPPDPEQPTAGIGMFILALGKHGAGELNYSSDIDLTVFFDPESPVFAECRDPLNRAVRMTKGIVKLLSDRNAEGYVHRVDLRLRPDPGSTPIAMPVEAALTYYETVGQNWERAAMIKARPVAGDIAAGDAFLKELIPFIWRKYFDYAAIADIHAMKRQIYAVKGHDKVAILGHDVKVGRGGIREIEFFVQTQQLVYGGRRPHLRGRQTLAMLDALRDDGWITAAAAADMAEAYRFLRAIEHRIQMVADEQTQRLPNNDEDLDRFAALCGYSRAGFEKALTRRLLSVENHYARLFEATPGLASEAGSLVFTGVEDDPETLDTLRKLGFAKPALVAETVRGWHFGRRTAVVSQRARENLTELVPALLESFGNSSDPDAALAGFDNALAKMPAAVELFSILKNHPGVRALFAEILGSAPRLAEIVSRAPHVLDIVVDTGYSRPIDVAGMEERIEAMSAREQLYEAFLEQTRVMARHENFLVATQVISSTITPIDAGRAHAAIAEAFLRVVLKRTMAELAQRHGVIPGASVAIVGYGKLGSREMTASSDLDLVIIYDAPADAMSDGDKPLFASEYYARVMNRLISALSSPLRTGKLYEIDVRLRPSGRKGPVAVSIAALENYQETEAETWEHMALSRARPVAGDAPLCARVSALQQHILRKARDDAALRKEIARMRALISAEKKPEGPFDLKLIPGGVVDVEFIAQYLTLSHARAHPDLVGLDPLAVVEKAGTLGLLTPGQSETLAAAHQLYSRLTQFLRIVLLDDRHADEQSPAFKIKLAQAAGQPSYKMLLTEVTSTAKAVRAIFETVVGPV